MEASGGTAEPEMLTPQLRRDWGGERGWWEERRDGEDEDGRGVRVCDAGLGRASGEARGCVWRVPRNEDVSVERERSAVVNTLPSDC